MIIAALHFFESSTNTFHFECGMMTPTLLDVAAITGLSPLGDTYDPCKASDTIKFDFRNKSYSKYIVENRKTSDEVSDEEHVAFLTLWLSQYVFCTQSLQVAKKFIPMAIQLHECQQFNFARLVLGCLYESMRDACEHLKRTGDGSTFLGAGPFWLLQLWLTATFHAKLDLFLSEPYYEESRTRQIEGTRLARMVPRERGLSYDVAFQQYFNAFLSLKKFKPSFAPFVDRPLGPPWFTHRFPSPPEFDMVTNSIWNAYLMPTVLSCRIGLTSGDFGLVGYFPNLVSRQFGLTQILPKSIYLEEREVCLGKHGMTEPQFHSFLNHFNQPSYELTPFDFAPSHACTREFFTWWSRHYEGRLVDKTALLTARGSKSKAGSSNSSKPLPPPPKVELKIASRKRPHSTETPSVSKKQRPIPATCSSAPDKDIPVLSTIPEQTNVATTQDLPHNAEPITDEKKKKKKKKKEHQPNQEGTPERKSSEIEAQPDTLASPEDPPLEQSERKKKKKKKQKKSPVAATVVEASATAKETTSQPEASATPQAQVGHSYFLLLPQLLTVLLILSWFHLFQPQNYAQVIPQDEPAPSKAAEGVVEGPSGTHPEDVAEKSPSPQPVETAILTETSSPPKAPGSPHRAFEDDTLKPNNDEDQLDQGLPQQNPLTNPAQVLTDNDPPTNFQADPAANTEQRPTVDGEHSTTNQPQPSGSNHESSSPSADTFDSDDGNSYIGDSLGEEGTSVSKPLPTVVLPAELAKELKDLTPVDALNKLLSSHGASSSAVEDTEGKEDVLEQEQFEHEIRFRREILNGDMLGLLERDSSIYYNIKALFRKLQNPRTDEAMFLLVTQAETFLEQFVSQSQLLTRTSSLLTSLLATQQHHFEQANNCNAEVTTIKAASDEALEQLVACENNIAQWQSEIEALKEKVRQEEAKMEKLAAVAIEAQKVKLDELAREGIQHYSDGLAVQKQVEHLASDKEMLQRKLVSIRTQYYQFQAANRKPPSTSQQQP
ncbi:uncharacterized protein LOC123896078 [Trifolium pratense]|uniref:uncharacterized protein LOC123896078 n=1 Tax=Trifolium pratense TaxID=57577 RepID=UPI001E696B23|nr:uncharacterized protein LOC123896078 [Trifolium pratense]